MYPHYAKMPSPHHQKKEINIYVRREMYVQICPFKPLNLLYWTFLPIKLLTWINVVNITRHKKNNQLIPRFVIVHHSYFIILPMYGAVAKRWRQGLACMVKPGRLTAWFPSYIWLDNCFRAWFYDESARLCLLHKEKKTDFTSRWTRMCFPVCNKQLNT